MHILGPINVKLAPHVANCKIVPTAVFEEVIGQQAPCVQGKVADARLSCILPILQSTVTARKTFQPAAHARL